MGRAAAEFAEARQRGSSADRHKTIAQVRANDSLNTPALHAQYEDIIVAGLRKLGIPEE